MSSIRCGKCEGTHDSVVAVKACYGLADIKEWSQPPPEPFVAPKEAVPVPNEAPAKVELEEGFWITPERTDTEGRPCIWKIQKSPNSGHLYAKQLVDGRWEYAPGAMKMLPYRAQPLTLEEAAKYGKLYGMCCICGRTLTNEASIEAGIGPICASKVV